MRLLYHTQTVERECTALYEFSNDIHFKPYRLKNVTSHPNLFRVCGYHIFCVSDRDAFFIMCEVNVEQCNNTT